MQKHRYYVQVCPQRRRSWHRPMCTVPKGTSELFPKPPVLLPVSITSMGGKHLCQQRKHIQPGTPIRHRVKPQKASGDVLGLRTLGMSISSLLWPEAGCFPLLLSIALHSVCCLVHLCNTEVHIPASSISQVPAGHVTNTGGGPKITKQAPKRQLLCMGPWARRVPFWLCNPSGSLIPHETKQGLCGSHPTRCLCVLQKLPLTQLAAMFAHSFQCYRNLCSRSWP